MSEYAMKARQAGEEAAKKLAHSFNGYCTDKTAIEAFAKHLVHNEHRTLQQAVMRVFMATIKEWAEAKKTGRFDLRNEDTVNTSAKILERLDPEDLVFRYI